MMDVAEGTATPEPFGGLDVVRGSMGPSMLNSFV